jgi:glutamyl-tRNA reductase
VVTNRSPEKAEALAAEIDGIAKPWADLEAHLAQADVVISSTGAREPILTKALVKRVMKARKYRLLVIIDIAVPRDAEPEVAKLDEVFCYNIDDLEQIVAGNLAERAKAAEQAARIVEHEAGQFEHWLRTQGVVPTIRALREHFAQVAGAEVARTLEALQRKVHTPAQQAEAITRLVNLVVNKLLHHPTTALREAAPDEAVVRAAIACQLFGLVPVEGDAPPALESAPALAEVSADDEEDERKAQA